MYSARITRDNPALVVFLIDQSGSMSEKIVFGNSSKTKAETVALVVNSTISELIHRSRRPEGIMNYFAVSAIGYSGSGVTELIGKNNIPVGTSILSMANCGKQRILTERIMPDGVPHIAETELKYWIEPKAEGDTPMAGALTQALNICSKWCKQNPDSYPPTIINVSDGEATDGDHESLISLAEQIKDISTSDGGTLLFNIHISSGVGEEPSIFISEHEEQPTNPYYKTLFSMSSSLPEIYNAHINLIRPGIQPPYKALGINISAEQLINIMTIGSVTVNNII